MVSGAAFRHGVARVDGDVEDGVVELPAIGEAPPQIVRCLYGKRYRIAQRPAQHAARLLQPSADIGRQRSQILAPGEERAIAWSVRLRAGAAQRRFGKIAILSPGAVAAIRLSRLPTTMLSRLLKSCGDAAGQLPDRLHLLRLAQLILGLDLTQGRLLRRGLRALNLDRLLARRV